MLLHAEDAGATLLAAALSATQQQERYFFAGGLCASLSHALATPIDVVKTRLMTQAAVVGAVPYTGVVDCVSTMLRTEGPGIFLAGIRPRMAYMGPLWALQFGLNGAATDATKKRKAAKAAAEKRK